MSPERPTGAMSLGRPTGAFWLVWNYEGGRPTHQHGSSQSAVDEAMRLARDHPGETFVVMQSVESMRVIDLERVDLRPDDIPF